MSKTNICTKNNYHCAIKNGNVGFWTSFSYNSRFDKSGISGEGWTGLWPRNMTNHGQQFNSIFDVINDQYKVNQSFDYMSLFLGTTNLIADDMSKSSASFRITNGTKGKFSPKIYPTGWKGGSRARITTYNFSKLGTKITFGTSILTTGKSYYEIATDTQNPFTLMDATVGTAGLMATIATYYSGAQIPYVGPFVALYGTMRLSWDVAFYMGYNYDPSTWYGDNN